MVVFTLAAMLIFRQLLDPVSSTYTYLLGCSATKEALLIDPVFEQARRDAALVTELGLKLTWTLDTHVHADHVTGAWLLKQRLGSRIALSTGSGASGADRLLVDGERLWQVNQMALPAACAQSTFRKGGGK